MFEKLILSKNKLKLLRLIFDKIKYEDIFDLDYNNIVGMTVGAFKKSLNNEIFDKLSSVMWM